MTRDEDLNRAFHDLLPALASRLDVREIFRQLSATAARIVPHDKANLILATGEKGGFELYASTDAASDVVCTKEASLALDLEQPRILDTVPAPHHDMQSGVTVPVRINDQFFGVFALFSRSADAYTAHDLALAQRLADYLAMALSHQRLAEAARQAVIERERAASIEASVELLRTISDVLDIRSVFPRVSEITNRMLPHDVMAMAFFDEQGRVVVQATSTPDFPEVRPYLAEQPLPCERLIGDLQTERLPVASGVDPTDQLIAAGYRSFFSVFTRARHQIMAITFLARRPHAFTRADVPVARRVADHIALTVSHEQLAEAALQVADARARADRLEARVRSLTEELNSRAEVRIVGQSAAWLGVLKKATQVAGTGTTVLLTGESGTGKEVVARFIHRASNRKNGPFVALNCAALPEQLLESELFGYERGAFTGAQQSKPGQIELAAGGVLFLDEVSEMSLTAQAKFLRVLQEHEFQRLGGTRTLKADVRVIAATNRDLRRAVEERTFREDLFYRLQVFDIHIPPLRERTNDILLLSEAFLEEIGRSFGRPPAGLSHGAREALLAYPWPGNVRELRNALERAAIVADGAEITAAHLALGRNGVARAGATTDLSIVERETIGRVLRETRWNKSRAAKRLGLSRTQLYVRMRKYGLDREEVVS